MKKLFKRTNDKETVKQNEELEDEISECRQWSMYCSYMLLESKKRNQVRHSIYSFTYPATAFIVEKYGPDVVIEKIKKYNSLRNDDVRTLTLMVNVSQLEIELNNEDDENDENN